ncbi:MAG: hypothetical protein M1817_003746 [Caeruleum heppii]|nr:MAG: hypothetical protein M1817_003746 [Caeruleum heppii]
MASTLHEPPPVADTATGVTQHTLLPAPVASLVSLVTKSSSLYVSIGSFIGGLAIDGARITTLTGLELSRAIVENVLLKAGGDVVGRSSGELGRADAEGLLERTVAALHNTLTSTSFLVSTGFHFSSAALSSSSALSLHLLSALDAILGSTESSRAIASIITLIRREFQNPETGVKGERVGVGDLLVGISGLALLQRWCRKADDREIQSRGGEELVWDVVILNDNSRHALAIAGRSHQANGDRLMASGGADQVERSMKKSRPCSFVAMPGQDGIFDTIRHYEDLQRGSQPLQRTHPHPAAADWPEMDLRKRITDQLPAHASVSVTTETVTTKTITVDVSGAALSDVAPPPGFCIVQEQTYLGDTTDSEDTDGPSNGQGNTVASTPWYRVVYKTLSNGFHSTETRPQIDSAQDDVLNSQQKQLPDAPYDILTSPRDTEMIQPSMSVSSGDDTLISPPYSRSSSVDHIDAIHMKTDPEPRRPDHENVDKAPTANQKRARDPAAITDAHARLVKPKSAGPSSIPKKVAQKEKHSADEKSKKKSTLRRALQLGSTNKGLANIWTSAEALPVEHKIKSQRPPWGSNYASTKKLPSPPNPSKTLRARRGEDVDRESHTVVSRHSNSRSFDQNHASHRGSPRAGYFSVHERRRDSVISQTDTYSIHSADPSRPSSPVTMRNFRAIATSASTARERSPERSIYGSRLVPPSPIKARPRSTSFIPSIYTLAGNNSETSLVISRKAETATLDTREGIMSLGRTGHLPGMFPQHHLVRNITRYVRFASASYGSQFLRIMGIAAVDPTSLLERDIAHHEEHHSFSSHTQLPPSTILLSSFVDPQGGSNAAGETETGVPLVHYVSLDHDSKAVVLTCRGTLGFEDILTDMTCDYDELRWRGKTYKVHKGIHASARRLLEGGGGRVMATIKAALEEFPEYGLVMCGHSLGGGVAAVLAILVSEPDAGGRTGSAFMTAADPRPAPLMLATAPTTSEVRPPTALQLPAGRPIHVYAYGPPATVSPSLRLATRGLVTTVVNGQDIVPYLSLGVLRDMQAVALAFKTDTSNAKREVRARVWEGLTNGISGRIYGEDGAFPRTGLGGTEGGDGEDQWAYAALKSLRASMMASKLLPPGEVFLVDTQPVLQKDAYTSSAEDSMNNVSDPMPEGPQAPKRFASLGRPATRAFLTFVRDVETRFGELRFGAGMLGDHSPGRYEKSLAALGKGVLDRLDQD